MYVRNFVVKTLLAYNSNDSNDWHEDPLQDPLDTDHVGREVRQVINITHHTFLVRHHLNIILKKTMNKFYF